MKARDFITLAASFTLMIGFGTSGLFWLWYRRGDVHRGLGAGFIFIFAMGLVHYLGGRLYAAQSRKQASKEAFVDGKPADQAEISQVSLNAIKLAVVQQVISGFLCALMLDMGESLRTWLAAMVAHWLVIMLCLGHRPLAPSVFTQGAIRYGFYLVLMTLGLAGVCLRSVWHI